MRYMLSFHAKRNRRWLVVGLIALASGVVLLRPSFSARQADAENAVARGESAVSQSADFAFRVSGFTVMLALTDEVEIARAASEVPRLPDDPAQMDGDAIFDGVFWGNARGDFAACMTEIFLEGDRARCAPRSSCEHLHLGRSAIFGGAAGDFTWFGSFTGIEVHPRQGEVDRPHKANLAHVRRYVDWVMNPQAAFKGLVPAGGIVQEIRTSDTVITLRWEDEHRRLQWIIRHRADDSTGLADALTTISANLSQGRTEIRHLEIGTAESLCHVSDWRSLSLPRTPDQLAMIHQPFEDIPDLTGRFFLFGHLKGQ